MRRERDAHSEAGARGWQVNGVKAVALGSPYEESLLAARTGFI
jgi:hypothetical protein